MVTPPKCSRCKKTLLRDNRDLLVFRNAHQYQSGLLPKTNGAPLDPQVVSTLALIDQTGGAGADQVEQVKTLSSSHQRADQPAPFPEVIVNQFGYEHLQLGDLKGAVEIMKLNGTVCKGVPQFTEHIRQPLRRLPGSWRKRPGAAKCKKGHRTTAQRHSRRRTTPQRRPRQRPAKNKPTHPAPRIVRINRTAEILAIAVDVKRRAAAAIVAPETLRPLAGRSVRKGSRDGRLHIRRRLRLGLP